MERSRRRTRAVVAAIALLAGASAGGAAQAVPFGPLPVGPPSALVPEAGPSGPLTGSISLDLAAVPVIAPTLLSLTDVSVAGGGASYALDPSLSSPGLGVVQPSGSFLIPTLFLRVTSGSESFDLAIPNVAGTLFFDAGGAVVGLASSFQIDSGTPAGVLTANLVAGVPEPGSAVLVVLGLGGLASMARTPRRKEIV